jgi:hypothetical protein
MLNMVLLEPGHCNCHACWKSVDAAPDDARAFQHQVSQLMIQCLPRQIKHEQLGKKAILLYQPEVTLSLPFCTLRELFVIAMTELAGDIVSGHFPVSTKRY